MSKRHYEPHLSCQNNDASFSKAALKVGEGILISQMGKMFLPTKLIMCMWKTIRRYFTFIGQ